MLYICLSYYKKISLKSVYIPLYSTQQHSICMKYEFANGVQIFFELILGVVAVALLLGGGLYALQTYQTALNPAAGGTTAAGNATGSIITALSTVPTWITIIVPVIGVVAVLGYFTFIRPGGRKK